VFQIARSVWPTTIYRCRCDLFAFHTIICQIPSYTNQVHNIVGNNKVIFLFCLPCKPSANATVRTKGPVAFEYHMYHIHQIALLRQFALLSNWIYNLTLLLALLLSISLHFLPLDVSLSCIPQHAQKK
jgi:hypothetical protein